MTDSRTAPILVIAAHILYPLRVMVQMETNEERIVAALHDVVEDSERSLERLRAEGFPEHVLVAIDSVTRRVGEPYDAFLLRAGRSPIGRRVKLANLHDNCDRRRIATLTDRDHARIEKYRRAIELLRDQAAGACP